LLRIESIPWIFAGIGHNFKNFINSFQSDMHFIAGMPPVDEGILSIYRQSPPPAGVQKLEYISSDCIDLLKELFSNPGILSVQYEIYT